MRQGGRAPAELEPEAAVGAAGADDDQVRVGRRVEQHRVGWPLHQRTADLGARVLGHVAQRVVETDRRPFLARAAAAS